MNTANAPAVPGANANANLPAVGGPEVNVGPAERVLSGLAGLGLLAFAAVDHRPGRDIPASLLGGYLLYRGVSGYCPISEAVGRNSAELQPVEVHQTMTVNKSREEVYDFWRQLENLPRFMKHLESVTQVDKKTSQWVAPVPGGLGRIEWRARIVEESPYERLAWQSDEDATVNNSGVVEFAEAPGDKGTEIRVTIAYLPPVADAGRAVAALFNPLFSRMIKEDIRRFKQYIETGETATNDGQPTGRGKDLRHKVSEAVL